MIDVQPFIDDLEGAKKYIDHFVEVSAKNHLRKSEISFDKLMGVKKKYRAPYATPTYITWGLFYNLPDYRQTPLFT